MSIRVPTHSAGKGRSTRVLHLSARNNAWKAGAAHSAVTGKYLAPYKGPSLTGHAHAYSRFLIDNGWRPYQQ